MSLRDPPAASASHSAGSGGVHGMGETKRSFLRMVSHELRTPLNSVIGFSEIISRELHGPISDPRYKAHAEIIRDSGLKLLKMVNQVLEIARLDAGAADLDIRPESAAVAVRSAVRSLEDAAAARRVEVRETIEEDAPLVLADARGLNTILTNLLQNAITFSPEGAVVEVCAHTRHNGLVFEVCDHGDGVAPQDLHRLMRPFEQGENALVRRTGGAGLGLSIVSLLCREMGGVLTLRSALGEGLTARVRLHARQAHGRLSPPSPRASGMRTCGAYDLIHRYRAGRPGG